VSIVGKVERNAYIFGALGVLSNALGFLSVAIFYQGRRGEGYSILNHFVSELGEYAHSELALVFNIGLIVGGIFFLGFMVGLSGQFSGVWKWIFGIAGLVTSVSGGLVGVFSMDNLRPHFSAAMTFFYSGLLITILFSVYVLFFDRKKQFARWLAVPGGFSAGAFFVFLFLTPPMMPEDGPVEAIFETLENRPPIIETAIFEWVVVISILAWILSLSIFLFRKTNQ
jgi:hypothetical membrane protein